MDSQEEMERLKHDWGDEPLTIPPEKHPSYSLQTSAQSHTPQPEFDASTHWAIQREAEAAHYAWELYLEQTTADSAENDRDTCTKTHTPANSAAKQDPPLAHHRQPGSQSSSHAHGLKPSRRKPSLTLMQTPLQSSGDWLLPAAPMTPTALDESAAAFAVEDASSENETNSDEDAFDDDEEDAEMDDSDFPLLPASSFPEVDLAATSTAASTSASISASTNDIHPRMIDRIVQNRAFGPNLLALSSSHPNAQSPANTLQSLQQPLQQPFLVHDLDPNPLITAALALLPPHQTQTAQSSISPSASSHSLSGAEQHEWGNVKEVLLTGIEAARSLPIVAPLLTGLQNLELRHTSPHPLPASLISLLPRFRKLQCLATDDSAWGTPAVPNISSPLSFPSLPPSLPSTSAGNSSGTSRPRLNPTMGVSVTSSTLPRTLRIIHLRRAQIARLPPKLPIRCPDLRELHVPHNHLAFLPYSFTECRHLRSLHLSHNVLSRIPTAVQYMTRLRDLHIPFNRISELPDCYQDSVMDCDDSTNSEPQTQRFGVALGLLTRLRSLHLHHNHISYLPTTINSLPSSLRDLHLHHNKISDIPDNIPLSLPLLRHLHLGNNSISRLSSAQALVHMTKLLVLDLHNNKLSCLPEILTKLSQLTRLMLDQNDLTVFLSLSTAAFIHPASLSLSSLSDAPNNAALTTSEEIKTFEQKHIIFPKLQHLSIGRNKLHALFPIPVVLPALTYLDLSFNRLSRIPEFICHWTSLVSMNVAINSIPELPASVSNLAKLKSLFIQGNTISQIPETVMFLQNLETFTLGSFTPDITSGGFIEAGNKLETLPDSLSLLTNLQRLFMRYNQFSWLPDCVSRLSSLSMISVENNRFNLIEESIWNAFVLKSQSLTISKKMPRVPLCIQKLHECKELVLTKSKFTALPTELQVLTGLTLLQISENKISAIEPAYFRAFQSMRVINLSRNGITDIGPDFEIPPDVAEIILDGNQLSEIPGPVRRLKRLEKISMEGNRLCDVLGEMESVCTLRHINLSQNAVTQIPGWVLQATGLTELQLWKNRISHVAEEISNLCQLQILTFGKGIKSAMDQVIRQMEAKSNFLSSLPRGVGSLTNLQELDISFNSISALPDSLTQLERLTCVSLIRNNLSDIDAELWSSHLLRQGTVKLVGGFHGPFTFEHTLRHVRHLTLNHVSSAHVGKILRRAPLVDTLVVEMKEPLSVPVGVFMDLGAIAVLNLTNCGLTQLPLDFVRLTNLRELHLCHNRLAQLPLDFGRLHMLQRVCLDNNPLANLPTSFADLHSLRVLSGRSMFLARLSEPLVRLHNLQTVLLGHNVITHLAADVTRLTALRLLHLSHNRLRGSLPSPLTSLTTLQELHLSHNGLTGIPDRVGTALADGNGTCLSLCFPALRVLRLDHNRFPSWPRSLRSLPSLRELSFSHNALPYVLSSEDGPDAAFFL